MNSTAITALRLEIRAQLFLASMLKDEHRDVEAEAARVRVIELREAIRELESKS